METTTDVGAVIHQTFDYGVFESITGNRSLNQAKIDKICADVQAGFNMLPYVPIIVSDKDGKLSIIDGQHRRVVSERTGNPVYYVVCNTLSLKQIALLNSRGEKWKPQDFLNCYVNLGIADYVAIQVLVKKYGIAIGVAVDMLMYNVPKMGSQSIEAFQDGNFKNLHYDEAVRVLELTEDVFGRYAFSKDRYLLAAVQELMKKGKCDFERLKAKIKAAPVMMDKQADKKRYLDNIERVYNYKVHNRDVIF